MSDWTLETALTTSLGIEHWALSIEIVDSFIWRISRSFFRCHKKNPPINMLTPNEYDGSYLKSYECASKTEPKDFIWWFSLFVGWLVFLIQNARLRDIRSQWWEFSFHRRETRTKSTDSFMQPVQIEFTENTNKKSSITTFVFFFVCSIHSLSLSRLFSPIHCIGIIRQQICSEVECNLNGNTQKHNRTKTAIPLL